VTIVTNPAHGTFSVNNGVVTYAPAVNFVGSDSFRYTIQDNDGFVSNPATVTIAVTFVPDFQNPNPAQRTDVNDSGETSPLDALIVINYINANSSGALPPDPAPPTKPEYYYDVDGDDIVAPNDVLQIINELNRRISAAAEGESAAAVLPSGGDSVSLSVPDAAALLVMPDYTRLAPAPAGLAVQAAPQARAARPAADPALTAVAVEAEGEAAELAREDAFQRLVAPDAGLTDLALDDVLADIAGDVNEAQTGLLAEDWVLSGLRPR
jgi:hypothetical protein